LKRRTIKTNHSGQIRCFKYVPYQDLVVTGSEDGTLEINQPLQVDANEIDFDEEANKMFVEADIEEMTELPSKKKVHLVLLYIGK
jgi:hypothetical protein